jgi:hypothetical protein
MRGAMTDGYGLRGTDDKTKQHKSNLYFSATRRVWAGSTVSSMDGTELNQKYLSQISRQEIAQNYQTCL